MQIITLLVLLKKLKAESQINKKVCHNNFQLQILFFLKNVQQKKDNKFWINGIKNW